MNNEFMNGQNNDRNMDTDNYQNVKGNTGEVQSGQKDASQMWNEGQNSGSTRNTEQNDSPVCSSVHNVK
ncbi:MAG: hypothetical protein LUF92_05290 [Clostridiales bacterium]|nr:hypothetical protein [Clostridiales bacterium]